MAIKVTGVTVIDDNLDADIENLTATSVQLTGGTGTQGTLTWNTDEETADLILNGSTLQLGQEIHIHARNNTASTITNGTPVYATGTLGASGRITVAPYIANGTIDAKYYLGLATEDIAAGTDGKITQFGKIRHIDTSAYSDGDVLYVSPTTAGTLTATEPTGTNISLPVAFVIHAASNGTLFTRTNNLNENAFATYSQGLLADSAVQPGDNVSTLTNDAGYATTSYVDTAESDAISAAATDATTKANTAETNAKSYADGIVATEASARSSGDSSTLSSAQSYTDSAIAGLVDTAPATLDTLNELAAALGDDPNFATTVSTNIGTKVSKSGDTMTGNLNFGDNDKAVFGAGSDLQIYHDGTHSRIDDEGTGKLILRGSDAVEIHKYTGEYMITAAADGAVSLYHDDSKKLATTSTGVDVTGTVTADGLTVDKGSDSSDIAKFTGSNTGRALAIQSFQSGSSAGAGFELNATSLEGAIRIATAGNDRALFSPNGDISFYEDTGTTAKFFWDASAEYLSVGGTTGTFAPINYLGSNGRFGINNGNTSGGTKIQSFATTNANGYLAFEGYDKEYMRIDSSGNVGIGTGVSGSVSPSLRLGNAGASGGDVTGTLSLGSYGTAFGSSITSSSNFSANSQSYLAFSTTPSGAVGGTQPIERMRIDSSGNVIVSNAGSGSLGRLTTRSDSGTPLAVSNEASSGTLVAFMGNGSGNLGSITHGGASVAYNTSSDYRLKEDWQPMVSNFDRVLALKPVNFAWKADGSRVDGFLAHELAEVVPEAVTGDKDAMRTEEYEVTPAVLDNEGNVVTEAVMGTREVPDYQAIDQSKLVPLLTAALQDAIAEIETLKADVAQLKGTI